MGVAPGGRRYGGYSPPPTWGRSSTSTSGSSMRRAPSCWKAPVISSWSASSLEQDRMRRGAPCSVPLHSFYIPAPWHFLNFLPLPHGHGSLRPTPAYGLLARTGTPGDAAGGRGPVAVDSAMRPSAAGLLATIFAGFGAGAPPSGPVIVLPAGGGGPTCTWSFNQRSASEVSRSCINPLNISNASDLYS